jgi:ubiquinone/menaquinone biosynthesis C-methylase UbiE
MGVPPGGKLLDVGTGPGFVAISVARRLRDSNCEIVGLDLSKAMLTVADENARRAGLNGMITWRQGDAKAMPFADGEFDFVVCNDSLHHWEDPPAVFDEMARVLKDGGQYFVHDLKRVQGWATRLASWLIGLMIPWDFRAHYRDSIQSSYTPDELRAILESSRLEGWRLVEDFMDLSVVKEA